MSLKRSDVRDIVALTSLIKAAEMEDRLMKSAAFFGLEGLREALPRLGDKLLDVGDRLMERSRLFDAIGRKGLRLFKKERPPYVPNPTDPYEFIYRLLKKKLRERYIKSKVSMA